jgi:hypothetical protein
MVESRSKDGLREELIAALAADPSLREDVAAAMQQARGELVFRIVLPTGSEARKDRKARGEKAPMGLFAPTLNEYGSLETWQRHKLSQALDGAIFIEKLKWPCPLAGFKTERSIVDGRLVSMRKGGRKRLVVVTRRSAHRVDEVTADVLGGKMPIDRLVHAGVLVGDAQNCIVREAHWEKLGADETAHVVVEVYELPDKPIVGWVRQTPLKARRRRAAPLPAFLKSKRSARKPK